jgi:hypothetical protein
MKMKNESDDAVSSSIEESMNGDFEDNEPKPTAFPDAIKALGETAFKKYPLKDSNISAENRLGMTQGLVLNDYFHKNFGYRFSSIDILIDDTMKRKVSVKAYGLTTLKEMLESLHASFENLDGGNDGIMKRIRGKI